MVDLRKFDYESNNLFPNKMVNYIVEKYNFLDYCNKISFIQLYSNKYDFHYKHFYKDWLMCVEKDDQPIVKKLKDDNKFNKFIPVLENMKFKNIDKIFLVYSTNVMFDINIIKVKESCVPKYMGFAASLSIDDKYFIFIDKNYFDNFSIIQQELIFLHEIGHKMINDERLVARNKHEVEITCDKMAIVTLSNLQGGKDIKLNISKNSTEFYNFLLSYGYCQNKAVRLRYKLYSLEELFKKNSVNIFSYNKRINQLEKFALEYGYGIQNKNKK